MDISLQSSKHRRISILKFLYAQDALSPEAIERMTSADVGAGVPVEGGHTPNEAISMFQPAPNLQLGVEKEAVRRDAREIVGFSRNQVGEFEQTGRRTATEAGIVDRSSQNRMSRRQMRVRDLYVGSFKKINPLIFAYWKTSRVQLVMDQNGVPIFKSFTGSDLQGDFNYDIEFTQDPPASPQQRKQEALQMYLGLLQDPTIDPRALRRYLANAFNDVEFSTIFQPGVLNGNANIPVPVSPVRGQTSGGPSNVQGGGGAPGVSNVPVGAPGQG